MVWVPLGVLVLGVVGYYAYIHFAWRAEVRRRRAEREALRERFRTGRVWEVE